jgi:Arc/MetJ family transcription regulator
MTLEQVQEWLWAHRPEDCDAVDMATRNDLREQIAELVNLMAQQERACGHQHPNSWVKHRPNGN